MTKRFEVKLKHSRRLYALALIFSLFQKQLEREDGAEEAPVLEDEEPEFARIRCPLCLWRPNASSRWACVDCAHPEHFHGGCGTVWNTFDTRGLCPGCGHQWRWTGCLNCHRWSLHEDWYAKDEDGR